MIFTVENLKFADFEIDRTECIKKIKHESQYGGWVKFFVPKQAQFTTKALIR